MASLYSNENYPIGIVEEPRKLGHDVMTAHEAGNAGRGVPDEEVLQLATEAGRAVITHNRRHFSRLHQDTNGEYAGNIACTYDPEEARQARRVHDAIAEAGGELAGMVLRVYRPNTA